MIRIADSQPPSTPAGLSATAIMAGSTTLTWRASTDNIGVRGYNIYRNNTLVNPFPVTTTQYIDTGLTEGESYTYAVAVVDYGGNESARSATVTLTGNRAPTAVRNGSPRNGNAPLTVSFHATGSSDPDPGDYILGYQWHFGDGSPIVALNTVEHTCTAAGTYYTARLRVMDNRKLWGAWVRVTFTVGGSTNATVLRPATAAVGRPISVEVFDLQGRPLVRRTAGTAGLPVSGV